MYEITPEDTLDTLFAKFNKSLGPNVLVACSVCNWSGKAKQLRSFLDVSVGLARMPCCPYCGLVTIKPAIG